MIPLLAATGFQKIIDFFVKGGVFMIPLIICSLVAVTIIILRIMVLQRRAVLPDFIEAEIERITPGAGTDRLARLAHTDDSPLARIVDTALTHLKWPKSENIEAVQTRARHELVRLESGLIVLEVIVGIAPLLGLLGTVSGLVNVFAALGTGANSADPRIVANGIAEALNTTIVGLAIAVPALIAFSYFSKKVETMSVEMESLIGDLLAKCYSEKKSPISRGQNAASAGSSAEMDVSSEFPPSRSALGRSADVGEPTLPGLTVEDQREPA